MHLVAKRLKRLGQFVSILHSSDAEYRAVLIVRVGTSASHSGRTWFESCPGGRLVSAVFAGKYCDGHDHLLFTSFPTTIHYFNIGTISFVFGKKGVS
jgi:hypothetical protein